MKKTIFILCMYISSNGHAHDSDKAFFQIVQKHNSVVVEAEFPWTIRNALLKEFPELDNSKSQMKFDKAFFNYIEEHLILLDDENQLKLLSIVKGTNGGHSHQNNYLLTFKGGFFNAIVNTIMFNLDNNQVNYHKIDIDNKRIEQPTNINNPKIILKDSTGKNISKFWFILPIFIICIMLIYRKVAIVNT